MQVVASIIVVNVLRVRWLAYVLVYGHIVLPYDACN